MKTITKILKTILGLLLLPFCLGAGQALYQALRESGTPGASAEAILGGALVWTLIFFFLPKPDTIYVFGHEMTHAIASWLFGGKLKKMRIGANGGEVLVTKSNFLTALAPYFLPFYAVIILIVFAIGNFFWNWSLYAPLFYFLLGAAYAFHITLTFHTLKTEQPDIAGQSYVFSGVVIFLGNVLVLLFAIALLDPAISFVHAFGGWLQDSANIYNYLFSLKG